jgi:hypothetical protein
MALTEDFTYQLGESGVILNPEDTTQAAFVDITDVRGLDSAPFRETTRDHEGTDGGFMDAEFEKGRSIILEGMAYARDANNVESLLDDLKGNWGPSRTLIPFYFLHPGVGIRHLMVKPLGVKYNVAAMRRTGQTEIQFQAFAEDPRIYGPASSINIPQHTVSNVGFAFPFEFPLAFASTPLVSGTIINVNGNRPTPATFSIMGPITDPVIEHVESGNVLAFDLEVPDMFELVIDLQYRTVKLSGQNRRSRLIEPNWFLLDPGQNTLRLSAATSNSSILVVTYKPAWR